MQTKLVPTLMIPIKRKLHHIKKSNRIKQKKNSLILLIRIIKLFFESIGVPAKKILGRQ